MPITTCNILASRELKKKEKEKKTRYSLHSAKFVVYLSFIDIRTLELCIYVCVFVLLLLF